MREPAKLDDLDWRLLERLQEDARVSTAELARQFKLSPPGVQKRLRRLEEKGVIDRYVTVVNREAVGLDLLCFVLVMLAHHRADSVKRFRAGVVAMPEVLECHHVAGDYSYLLKLRLTGTSHLERFLSEQVKSIGGIQRTHSIISLSTVKETREIDTSVIGIG